jgi:hypothetical protein
MPILVAPGWLAKVGGRRTLLNRSLEERSEPAVIAPANIGIRMSAMLTTNSTAEDYLNGNCFANAGGLAESLPGLRQ